MTSFNTLALNGSTLSVNGTDYNLSLAQTAEATDSSLSSFKGVAAVDNGDGTISLTVGENSMVVEKYETVVMPTKGDLITMSLGNAAPAAGTNNQYRVLKIDGTIAEVVAMFEPISSQIFSTTNNTYANSALDQYLNTNWYSGLNDTAQKAIVENEIQQYQYPYSATIYNATTHASHADYSTKVAKGSSIKRKVYALDIEDVEMYFGGASSTIGTFSIEDLYTTFWNTSSRPRPLNNFWIRSARNIGTISFYVSGVIDSYGVSNVLAVRPAFTIDLSKIEWRKV